jgi:hypothetical protein
VTTTLIRNGHLVIHQAYFVPTMTRSILSFLTLAAVSLQASAYGTLKNHNDYKTKVVDRNKVQISVHHGDGLAIRGMNES